MTKARLRYLSSDSDRHGNIRYYVRLPGKPKIRIHEIFEDESGCITEEFMAAYHAAIRGKKEAPKKRLPVREDTFNWLVDKYYKSAEFESLEAATQKNKKRHLDAFLEVAGNLPYKMYRQDDVIKSRNKRKNTPAEADNFVKTLKRLFNWAIENKLATNNPCHKVPKIHSSSGHHTWTKAEHKQYRDHYPLGTTPRLAFEILFGEGMRRSDAALIGPEHEDRGFLVFTAFKNRKRRPTTVTVEITSELREALAVTKTGKSTYLINEKGKPYSIEGFGNQFKKWCIEAGLPDRCTAHGVRKATAVDHAESGASVDELKAMFGWRKAETAEIYTKAAQDRTLARNAAKRRREKRDDE